MPFYAILWSLERAKNLLFSSANRSCGVPSGVHVSLRVNLRVDLGVDKNGTMMCIGQFKG